MKAILPRLALVLSAGLSVGCASATTRVALQALDSASAGLAGDPEIENRLETLALRTVHAGKQRSLEFEIRNKSSEKQSFAWALEWYDRAGRRIGAATTAWTPMTLDPRASRAVKAPMPPEAESSRLRAIRS